jgi:dTDP-4-dehydrorhamnose reductase
VRILVTGQRGQVGWELQRALATLGEVIAVDVDRMDLANPTEVVREVRDVAPDLIVNPGAYTAVDRAEEEQQLAFAVNGTAPGVLAEEARRAGAALIHYSTDYVFDGSKDEPYREEDATNPLSVYGRSKLAGESAVTAVGGAYLILRTSWVFGARGENFATTILRLAHERQVLRVVDDQVGAPTWCRFLAEATAQLVARAGRHPVGFFRERGGLYHISGAGRTSWHGFTKLLLELQPSNPGQHLARLEAIPTSAYPTRARRPANSVLANDRLRDTFDIALPDWQVGVRLAFG